MFNILKNSQNGQHGFWSVQGKLNFLGGFSSVFAFKQAKEQILFQVQSLKMLNEKHFFAHFRVTVQICWGPATSENATLRHEILELGSYNNLAQHRMCNFLFFKITPP